LNQHTLANTGPGWISNIAYPSKNFSFCEKKSHHGHMSNLVGGIPNHQKNMCSSVGIFPYIYIFMESHKIPWFQTSKKWSMATMGALSNKQWDVLYKLSLGVYIYTYNNW
jgi:hypothetical protein